MNLAKIKKRCVASHQWINRLYINKRKQMASEWGIEIREV